MSRIGRKPVLVPAGVTVNVEGTHVEVKGPKGSLSETLHSNMMVEVEDNKILIKRPNDNVTNRSLHGLSRSLVANMIDGVTKGFMKELKLVGVGYRAQKKGSTLILHVGYSHPVEMTPPEGIEIEVPSNTQIIIKGIDKQMVGQYSAEIREVRKPEPYKGKGIRYKDEIVRLKVGKTG